MADRFGRFAAIDWSGAKGDRHKGIAIAIAERGDGAPVIVRKGHRWSRAEVLEWLLALAGGPPTLVGMDFSFAPPFATRGAYLPGVATASDARGFWAYVDACCNDIDLGAGSFLEKRHRDHFYFGSSDGPKAAYMHFRTCELAFNATGGGKPSTVFDAIGAAQVAKASFSGMRVLHRIGGAIPIWPFDCAASNNLIVEIYCRAFIRHAGLRGLKLRSAIALNEALAALGSAPTHCADFSDHETDALIAAAGMRRIADDARYWSPPLMSSAIARTEGWTFGVA